MTASTRTALRSLARLHGIQSSYLDVRGARIQAPDETLYELLAALGVPVDCNADIRAVQRESLVHRMRTPVEPVIVAWDGHVPPIEVRSHATTTAAPALTLQLEDGTIHTEEHGFHNISSRETDIEGIRISTRTYLCREVLPYGYHQLYWHVGHRHGESLVVSAPVQCYHSNSAQAEWGVFAPLYALRSSSDWGAGSYSELRNLAGWVHEYGGDILGTLPILPCFYDLESEPSPYLPVTRLLWSDFFVDIADIDFLGECPEALDTLAGAEFVAKREKLKRAPSVNYSAVLGLKRKVLEQLARHAADQPGLAHQIEEFLRSTPIVRDYATFRAAMETRGEPWHHWPSDMREGTLTSTDIDPEVRSYYEFVQWIAHRQVGSIADSANASGLYLDLPVGVHPDGYDAWRHRESHLHRVSCGAPPDLVFTTGQNWLAPPLNPEGIRRDGYRYWRLCLRHHMHRCNLLRIDHVMGLHRMFCIPHGASAMEGTYLRYRPDELYAVLSLESHINKTAVVGEDLGTVPEEVRQTMSRHSLNRMFVLYYEMPALGEEKSFRIPRNSLACISTHDMPPFASMWREIDLSQQVHLGIMAAGDVSTAYEQRRSTKERLLLWLRDHAPVKPTCDEMSILRSILSWLGASRASYVIANLEDFWLETRQPNIPGAGTRHPNWTQRTAMTLEQLRQDSHISSMIGILEKERARRREAIKKGDNYD